MDDAETRNRLLTAEAQISKIWTFVREIATVLWGDDKTRDNGVRSRVDALEENDAEREKTQAELKEALRHYLDAERKETCHGLAALKSHEDTHANKAKGATELTIEKMKSKTMVRVQYIQLIGIILVALIALLK